MFEFEPKLIMMLETTQEPQEKLWKFGSNYYYYWLCDFSRLSDEYTAHYGFGYEAKTGDTTYSYTVMGKKENLTLYWYNYYNYYQETVPIATAQFNKSGYQYNYITFG